MIEGNAQVLAGPQDATKATLGLRLNLENSAYREAFRGYIPADTKNDSPSGSNSNRFSDTVRRHSSFSSAPGIL